MIKLLNKILLSLLLLSGMLSLQGCFFNDAPEAENESIFIVERLQNSCDINSEKLANILTEDVSKEIDCVQAKLDQFAKYVRRDDPRYINRQEISRFITKFFPEDAQKLNGSLGLLFDFAHLVLEDKENVISLSNIAPLAQMFKTFNREALYIHNLINEELPNNKDDSIICRYSTQRSCYDSFMMKRARYRAATERLARYVSTLLRGKKQHIDSLDIIKFLVDANEAFKTNPTDEDAIDVDLVRSLLFIKRIFLGGSKNQLKTDEVYNLLKKIPYFSTLLFDFRYGTQEVFESKPNEQTRLFANHMNSLKENIAHSFAQDEIVFTTQELINALNEVVAGQDQDDEDDSSLSGMFDDVDFNNFKSVLETLKEKILGGNALFYTAPDIDNILTLGQEVLEDMYYNSVVYDYYQVRMEDPAPIAELIQPTVEDIPELAYVRSEFQDKYWAIFDHIVKKYRYYGNSDDHMQIYHQDIVRSKYGLNEIYVLRWFSDRLLRGFGSPAPNGEYYGDVDQVEAALLALKPLLVELNFWPKRFETFAFNMVTLSDLFQPQSNGDIHMGLDEMTEYFELVISTINIHDRVQKQMLEYCEDLPNPNPEEPTTDPIFDPQCYREHFFTVLFDDLHLENKLPRLYEYYRDSSAASMVKYHKYVEEFARDDMNNPDGSPVLMFNRDRTLTIGAMLNIESAYVAFDTRRVDNRLTYGELEDAYLLFKNIIIELGELTGSKKKYARSVFYFMVEHKREPSTWEVAKYYYWSRRRGHFKNITAYRMNIAAILAYFKKKSMEQAQNPAQ